MTEATFVWKTVRYEVADGVAVLTLFRPDRGNAWTGRLEHEYRRALAMADSDPQVGAIVITGAGRCFCVGADQAAMDNMSREGSYDAGLREPNAEPGDPAHPAHGTRHGFLLSIRKPVIAAVNGPAAGIGFAIFCFCDIRFAAADAKLTASTSRLGLAAEFGVSWILPRLIGGARATELLLSSRVVSGTEALSMGLVHQAPPREDVLAEAVAYAKQMVRENAPSSLRTIKWQMWETFSATFRASEERSAQLLHEMVGKPEFAEGVRAVIERRPPNFLGFYSDSSS